MLDSSTHCPFSKWAIVSHNDDTGFGRQAADLREVLNIGWHFVIPSERLFDKPLMGPKEKMLPVNATDEYVREILNNVVGVIFFERPDWHPSLLKICRELGVMSICCPNWEWFNGKNPLWQLCDLFVCTSRFSRKIVEHYGFKQIVDVGPWPLNAKLFDRRQISGEARTFIHNAGIVDPQDRKGTRDTIRAFLKVKRPDIRLIVRMQKPAELPAFSDSRIEVRIGNLSEPRELYKEGDVAIQPSKMEGNGFMVLEPLLCGLPVITLDYAPMNEYITDKRLLVRKQPFKRRAFPTAWIKHAHLRVPSLKDLSKKISWCSANDLTDISNANNQYSLATWNIEHLRAKWRDVLTALN